MNCSYFAVSRRILKDHYQGEVEPDESGDHPAMDNEDFMSENSFESDDYAEPAVSGATATPTHHDDDGHRDPAAASAASANDHPANYRTTNRPDHTKRTDGFFGNHRARIARRDSFIRFLHVFLHPSTIRR